MTIYNSPDIAVTVDKTLFQTHRLVLKGRVRHEPFAWRDYILRFTVPELSNPHLYIEMLDKASRDLFLKAVLHHLRQTHPLAILAACPSLSTRRNPPGWFLERYPSIRELDLKCTFLPSEQ